MRSNEKLKRNTRWEKKQTENEEPLGISYLIPCGQYTVSALSTRGNARLSETEIMIPAISEMKRRIQQSEVRRTIRPVQSHHSKITKVIQQNRKIVKKEKNKLGESLLYKIELFYKNIMMFKF